MFLLSPTCSVHRNQFYFEIAIRNAATASKSHALSLEQKPEVLKLFTKTSENFGVGTTKIQSIKRMAELAVHTDVETDREKSKFRRLF